MIRRFHVAGLIARGGMGEVYLATDAVLGRDLALKILRQDVTRDRDRIARFIQEARAASALNHPHLIAIYDIGESTPKRDGKAIGLPVHYIAMELVDGHTLRQIIAGKRLDLATALDGLAQVADALAAAHAAGVIHRDLKPENLMIAANGYAKVLDFGVAKLREDLHDPGPSRVLSESTLTTDGVLLGTVGYVSPEQARGLPVDHRSDIFSFGCVLYEAITGTRAFQGASAAETLTRIAEEEPAPIAGVAGAPGLARIVSRCLAKDPAMRYQSMSEVAADLRGLRRQLEPAAGAGTLSRRSMLTIGMAGFAVALAGWWNFAGGTRGVTRAVTVERLTTSGTAIDAALSPDGRFLAWVTSAGGLQGLRVRELRGTNDIEVVAPARVGFWGIAFSRDGSRIFYTTKSAEDPAGRLYAVGTEGGAPQPILEGVDSTISMSPDGRRFAFYRAGFPDRGATALLVASIDGRDVRVLAAARGTEFFVPAFFAAPAWSPDGSRIAAAIHDSAQGDARVVTVNVETGQQESLAPRFEDATFTSWLPDGSGILVVASQSEGLREYPRKVWLLPHPSGAPRRITTDVLEYRNVSVRSDGRAFVSVGLDAAYSLWRVPLGSGRDAAAQRIASERYDGLLGIATLPDGGIVVSAGERGNSQLARLDASGTQRTTLTTEGVNLWPAASLDGTALAFVSNRDGETGVWRMNADGTGARLLAHLPAPTWLSITPDGQWVICASLREGEPAIWRVPMEGGEPLLVAAGLDRPAVSPDGRSIAAIDLRGVSGQLNLVVAPLDASAPPQVLGTIAPATGNGLLEWTADGRGILFSTVERTNVWLQRLDGGAPVRITDLTELGISRGRRSADGRSLIVTRGVAQTDAYLISDFR